MPSSLILFVFFISVILISEWAGQVGEVQRSEQAEVRTQEREAECNRGRTTCRPAWDVPIGSSRSGGPESLPAGPACVFWGVGEMKRNQACVKNRRHPPRFADKGLWTIVFHWSSVIALENKSIHLCGLSPTLPVTHISMVRSFRKSLCSGFSTSTTPQGYRRPLTFFPLASICWLDPTTANGILAWAKKEIETPQNNIVDYSNRWQSLLTPMESLHRTWGRLTFRILVCSLKSSSSSDSASGRW